MSHLIYKIGSNQVLAECTIVGVECGVTCTRCNPEDGYAISDELAKETRDIADGYWCDGKTVRLATTEEKAAFDPTAG